MGLQVDIDFHGTGNLINNIIQVQRRFLEKIFVRISM